VRLNLLFLGLAAWVEQLKLILHLVKLRQAKSSYKHLVVEAGANGRLITMARVVEVEGLVLLEQVVLQLPEAMVETILYKPRHKAILWVGAVPKVGLMQMAPMQSTAEVLEEAGK